MNCHKTIGVAIAGLMCVPALLAQAPAPVRIDNTPAAPMIIRDAKAKYKRVQHQLDIVSGQPYPIYTVPAGKRLVVERVIFEGVAAQGVWPSLNLQNDYVWAAFPLEADLIDTTNSKGPTGLHLKVYWGVTTGEFIASTQVKPTVIIPNTQGFLSAKVILIGYLMDLN